jgi:hypothetical protein
MQWILVAGALCLSAHNDICVHVHLGDAPFTLTSPVDRDGLPFWTLDSAKMAGEKRAEELAEFQGETK